MFEMFEEQEGEVMTTSAYDAAFLAGYEECADSDSDSGILGIEESENVIGWHADTEKLFADDCSAFCTYHAADLQACGLDARRAGQDFWLTRNGHGAGYWDEGYQKSDAANAALTRLTAAAHVYGSCDLYVSDDGWIYAS